MQDIKKVCIFCGSSPGRRPDYLEAARAMGEELARRGLGLVYGGSALGMMGAVANAVLEGGAEAVGVIPKALATKEKAHFGLSELHVVRSMHERKAMMADLSDAFVAMPGGMGTLEELCEIITWAQLGIHTRPIGLLNVAGYFDGLVRFIDHMVAEEYLPAHHRALLCVEATPQALLDAMLRAPTPAGPMWLGPDES